MVRATGTCHRGHPLEWGPPNPSHPSGVSFCRTCKADRQRARPRGPFTGRTRERRCFGCQKTFTHPWRRTCSAECLKAVRQQTARDMAIDRGVGVYWTRSRVLSAFRRYAKRHGGMAPTYVPRGHVPTNSLAGEGRGELPSQPTVVRLFGSWPGAVREAGLTPRPKSPMRKRCRRGHPLTGANVRLNGGSRTCRICDNANAVERYRRLHPTDSSNRTGGR